MVKFFCVAAIKSKHKSNNFSRFFFEFANSKAINTAANGGNSYIDRRIIANLNIQCFYSVFIKIEFIILVETTNIALIIRRLYH